MAEHLNTKQEVVALYGARVLGSKSPESRWHNLAWLKTYYEGLLSDVK